MRQLIYRQNSQFVIDQSQLKPAAKKQDVINALYGAIYLEFRGANKNSKYENKTNLERFQLINEFAKDWLAKRGLN